MKKISNKCYVFCPILLIAFLLYGCGASNSEVGNQNGTIITQEDVLYVTQDIPLPAYSSFDGAYSNGNDLYYAAAEFNESSQTFQTSFYSLKQGDADPQMNFSLAENQRVQSMTMDSEGNIYYLGYEEPSLKNSESPASTGTMLYKSDPKGMPILELNLSEYTKGQDQTMVQDLSVDGESRIVLCDSNQNIYMLNQNGELLFEVRADGRIYDLCNSNGKVLVVHSSMDGMEVREVDIDGKKLSSKLISGIPGTQFHMTAGSNGNLLIASEESVYQYMFETRETLKKFDWQTHDFTGIITGMLLPYGENGILVINQDYAAIPMKAKATVFRVATEGETMVEGKKVITLGITDKLKWVRGDAIANFNKINPNYKIEIKNYQGDYTRLNTELIAGNGPDILALPSYRANLLAEKGVLEDLNPYFDEDETINRSDYYENVLKAFEEEGHLYVMPITFRISTMVGKNSFLGGREGWTLEEFISFAENCPEGTPLFDNTSKSGVMRLLKYANSRQLVDMKNTENPLNRELLIKMLTFANQYDSDERYVQEINMLNHKILNGQVMLPDVIIVTAYDYFGYSCMFGEPVTFIGYPTEDGNGSLIISDNTYSINSDSEYKDVAWEFISTLLSDKGQEIMRFGDVPLKKDKWSLVTHAISWTENSIVRSASMIGDSDDSTNDIAYYFPAGSKASSEDAQRILDLIQNADTAVHISPDIDKIIQEEAVFYFNGTKPIEEVVDVIENRIRTYVNEMQ
ncbi:extracellular solute-binding protein [Kineothrix sp. MB12-C1]|uniref:extracellular solute-binding protein n=1 Tax=Kineothrix sp. MB12-C1 TaxID=3070215 RepID=UPI0027D309CE|nr:extracellular solute-binding protein [Kineothrix sp. MB12-C1]WMC93050.1 extracellular solute-binding protein [Kineothrix sp. MB12-C1]